MTTEVLRNMLLTESDQLRTLGLVVLDEVHYLQDPFRGGVWEEVIILTPRGRAFRRSLGDHRQRQLHRGVVRRGSRTDRDHRGERTPDPTAQSLGRRASWPAQVEIVDLLDGPRLSDEARRIDNLMKATQQVPTRTEVEGTQDQRPAAPVSRAAAQRTPSGARTRGTPAGHRLHLLARRL